MDDAARPTTAPTATPASPSDIIARLHKASAQLLAPGGPFELETVTPADGRSVRVFRHAFATLPQLIAAGRAHGTREFIVHEGERWTFDRLFAEADALAGRLQADWGLRPGDRVAIALRNRPEWAAAFVGTVLAGGVPVPLNSFGLHDELTAALRLTTPRVLVADTQRLDRLGADLAMPGMAVIEVSEGAEVAEVAAGAGQSSRSVREGAVAWSAAAGPGGPAPVQPLAAGPDDPALILFTSGATSQAKGVVSSHRAVCQALFNIDFIGALSAMTSPAALAAYMKGGFAPTTLTAVPLFHVSGLHAQLLTALRHGRRLVFMRRWDPAQAIELVQAEGITQFNGAPSMVMQFVEHPGFDRSGATRSLGGLGFGGAGLPQRLVDGVRSRMAGTMSGIGFGLTETNGVGAAASGELFEHAPRAAGWLSPIIDCRIVDPAGADQPQGGSGEIWLRGACVMQGYWAQTEATAQAMPEGWFRTGDVGFIDADGLLHVIDRLKDVINRSGEKIAAAEVESCLLLHPGVAEVAVFGVPDELTGEAVVAQVVLQAGSRLQATDLRAHAAGLIAAHKVPVAVRLQLEPLPRNPAGKVLKPLLRSLWDCGSGGTGVNR